MKYLIPLDINASQFKFYRQRERFVFQGGGGGNESVIITLNYGYKESKGQKHSKENGI